MFYNTIAKVFNQRKTFAPAKSLLLTTVALLGLTATSQSQTIPAYVPKDSLVGWWPFNGNANDISGNGYNGTALNGAMLVNDRNGIGNSAYGFDGSDDLIQTTLPYTDLIGSKGLSVSAWINLGSTSSTWGYSIITNHFPSATQFAFALGGTNDGTNHRKLVFFFNSFSGGSQPVYCPVRPIIVNQWTHVACTVKSDTVNFFINGSLIYSKSVLFDSLSTEGTAPNVKIGQGNPTNGFRQDWNGFIDDIAIWNRALDSCEIKDLFYASLGNCCNIKVVTQPTNQTSNINNNTKFLISSTDPSATYQWQTDLGQGYVNVVNGGQYSGVASDTLFVSNLSMQNHRQKFRCVVKSGSCSDTSNVAMLEVCGSIVTQPQFVTAKINNQGRFICQSNDSLASYQWQTDLGVGFQNMSSVGQYSGANNDTLLVSNVSMSNDKQPFRCIVTSGSCIDTSLVAVLNIQNCINGFKTQPVNQNIPVGGSATWIAGANDSNATYQWQTDLGVGFQNLSSVGQYSGSTNDTLVVSNVTMANHNQPFRCIITAGSCKDTSTAAVLTVNNMSGLEEAVRAQDFMIYPNPASTHITIDFGEYSSLRGYTLRIVNMLGQMIYTTPVQQACSQINLSSLSGKGLYFVQIIDPQQKTIECRKLQIQ